MGWTDSNHHQFKIGDKLRCSSEMTQGCSPEMTHREPDQRRSRYAMIDGVIRSASMLYGVSTIVSA
jgi:hypothetical protein